MATPEFENIILEYRNDVGIIKLNAPQVLNALDGAMLTELNAAIEDVIASPSRCLLLTSEGRAFCAGANLQSLGASDSPLPPAGHVLESHYLPIMSRLRTMEIPMVTAINGPAVGIGMSLAIMSDFAVAVKEAYFLQAFANIGLVPDGGATWLLPRIVGWRRAMELSMLAERLPAEQALEWGLINRVVAADQLLDEAMVVAEKFAHGPRSLGLIRQLYWESFSNGFAEQFQLEVVNQRKAERSEDNREGIKAFLEKRPAVFKGR